MFLLIISFENRIKLDKWMNKLVERLTFHLAKSIFWILSFIKVCPQLSQFFRCFPQSWIKAIRAHGHNHENLPDLEDKEFIDKPTMILTWRCSQNSDAILLSFRFRDIMKSNYTEQNPISSSLEDFVLN